MQIYFDQTDNGEDPQETYGETMQKALSELEDTGLVISNRTSGKFVTEDEALIDKIKDELAKEYCDDFISRLNQIGFSNEDIKKIINEMI